MEKERCKSAVKMGLSEVEKQEIRYGIIECLRLEETLKGIPVPQDNLLEPPPRSSYVRCSRQEWKNEEQIFILVLNSGK